MKNKQGFSTVELICGIGIISITLLMVVALYSYMIKASAKGIENTVASSISERVLSELSNNISSDGKITSYQFLASDNNRNIYAGSTLIDKRVYCFIIETLPISFSNRNGSSSMVKVTIAVFYKTGEEQESSETYNAMSFFSGIRTIEEAIDKRGAKGDGTGFSFVKIVKLYSVTS